MVRFETPKMQMNLLVNKASWDVRFMLRINRKNRELHGEKARMDMKHDRPHNNTVVASAHQGRVSLIALRPVQCERTAWLLSSATSRTGTRSPIIGGRSPPTPQAIGGM